MKKLIKVLVATAFFLPLTASAADPFWLGVWRLDVAKTREAQGKLSPARQRAYERMKQAEDTNMLPTVTISDGNIETTAFNRTKRASYEVLDQVDDNTVDMEVTYDDGTTEKVQYCRNGNDWMILKTNSPEPVYLHRIAK